jgi:hypothetical protein
VNTGTHNRSGNAFDEDEPSDLLHTIADIGRGAELGMSTGLVENLVERVRRRCCLRLVGERHAGAMRGGMRTSATLV